MKIMMKVGDDKETLELGARDHRESCPHAHLPEDQSYKHSSDGMSKEKRDSYLAELNGMSEEEIAELNARLSNLSIKYMETASEIEELVRKSGGDDKETRLENLAQVKARLSKSNIECREHASRFEKLSRKSGGDDKETLELGARDHRESCPHAHLPEDQSYKHSSDGMSKEKRDSYLAELNGMSEEEIAELNARLSNLSIKYMETASEIEELVRKSGGDDKETRLENLAQVKARLSKSNIECREHASRFEKLSRKSGGDDKETLELGARDHRESCPHAHLPEDQSYKHSSDGMSKEKRDSYLAELNGMSEEEIAELNARLSNLSIKYMETASEIEELVRKSGGDDKETRLENLAQVKARLSKSNIECREHASRFEKLGRKSGGDDKATLELGARDHRESCPHAHLPEDQTYKHSSDGMSKEEYLAELNGSPKKR